MTKEMVKTMAKNPIVFALANPDPEISYKDAIASRDDIIIATISGGITVSDFILIA